MMRAFALGVGLGFLFVGAVGYLIVPSYPYNILYILLGIVISIASLNNTNH